LHRMAEAVEVETGSVLIADDQADSAEGDGTEMPRVTDEGVMVYRISGAFFVGATATVGAVLLRIGAHPKAFILDFSEVPFVDSTAAKSLEGFAKKLNRAGTTVYFTSTSKQVRRTLLNAGLRRPLIHYAATLEDALAAARESAPTQEG
ncbi:MAG: sodium-independent anion transporter, partial [Hyphomicrobium denitrificans]|nr:sodium-independent anion transporter [Hyphomicrobium denitrificans]